MWNVVHGFSDPLAWIAIGGFFVAMIAELRDRRDLAVPIAAVAWVAFGAFWFAMFPYFFFEFQSPLESLLSLAAVPLCIWAGILLYRGRESLLLLSRAVAIMGAIYFPAMMYEPLTRWLIETVAIQTHAGMELLGYSPGLVEGPDGYESKFGFQGYTTYIVLACTGIGSMAIFGGLIAATRADWSRKLAAIAASVGIIWILNLMRNVFIGLSSSLGWFDYPVFITLSEYFTGSARQTSYFVSHHLIGQTLAVVALIGIAYIVIRIVPEVMDILEEALFVATGSDWGLSEVLGESSVRRDGGDP